MVEVIFRNTTTIGIRETLKSRYVLERTIEKEDTEFGLVRKKVSNGYGITREKYEHDDLAEITRRNDLSLSEVKARLKKQ